MYLLDYLTKTVQKWKKSFQTKIVICLFVCVLLAHRFIFHKTKKSYLVCSELKHIQLADLITWQKCPLITMFQVFSFIFNEDHWNICFEMFKEKSGKHLFFLLHFFNEFRLVSWQRERVGDNADDIVVLQINQTCFFQLFEWLDKTTCWPGKSIVRSLGS